MGHKGETVFLGIMGMGLGLRNFEKINGERKIRFWCDIKARQC